MSEKESLGRRLARLTHEANVISVELDHELVAMLELAADMIEKPGVCPDHLQAKFVEAMRGAAKHISVVTDLVRHIVNSLPDEEGPRIFKGSGPIPEA